LNPCCYDGVELGWVTVFVMACVSHGPVTAGMSSTRFTVKKCALTKN